MKSIEWFKWVVATTVAAISMSIGVVTSAYAIFETKESAQQIYLVLKERLDRIEEKLDRIYQWQQKKE